MRVAVVQNEPAFGRTEENLRAVERLLGRAPAFDLAVLPELFASGYRFRDRAELAGLAETLPGGPTVRALEDWARARGAFLVAGLPERAGDAFYNSAVLVGPEGLLGRYRKVHLFDEEKELFAPGDEGFPVFRAGDAVLGILVCFDWIFPEAARTLALRGARILCHPANLVLPWCQRAMAARAVENRVFTVTANRTGRERGLAFTGGSVVWSPRMEPLLELPPGRPEVGVVALDPSEADDKRPTPRNHLFDDRRPDCYER